MGTQLKNLVVITSAAVLSGCATLADYQSECEQVNNDLRLVAPCVRQKVAADSRPGMRRDPKVDLYILKIEEVGERVAARQLTLLQARIELKELYVRLKSIHDAERAIEQDRLHESLRSLQNSRPVYTQCNQIGNTFNCTTR